MKLQSMIIMAGGVAALPQGSSVSHHGGLGQALSARAVSPDNSCGTTGNGGSASGYTCPSDLGCCSVNGWCGTTSDYCAAANGCQTAFGTCNDTAVAAPADSETTTGGQCGVGFGSCAATECCSPSGWCGTTEEYCASPDCLTAYGPACDANLVPIGTNTSSLTRALLGSVLYGDAGIYECTTPGTVAITYDDGPYIYTDHVLDLFKQYNGTATFFITGINNGKGAIDDSSTPWPAVIKRMHAEGHQIASHTWSHADLCKISSAERKNEMYKNEMALRNILGFIPTYMRPPYSSCTAECGCEADMLELGYHVSYFDLDTSDYLNTAPNLIQNAKNLFSTAITGSNPSTQDFLAIAHDIHDQTANNLTEFMLQTLQTTGYRAVTLGECLGDAQANWYRTDASVTIGV